MNLATFLARFPEVVEERDGWVVPCPAHADGRPSLRVAVNATGALMLHCRSGCSKNDVVAALGLGYDDLFSVTGTEGVKTSAATDDPPGPDELAALDVYLAERREAFAGSVAEAYALDRFGLDPAHAEVIGLGFDEGGRRDAFLWLGAAYLRVPRLVVPFRNFEGRAMGLQARDVGSTSPVRWCGLSNPPGMSWTKTAVFDLGTGLDVVLVTEGPADALTAVGAGYDAIAIRGAALARNAAAVEDLLPHLRDRRVVLAGDADASGQDFNAVLSRRLAEAGIQVQVLDIAAGGDLNEWRTADPAGFANALAAGIAGAGRVTAGPRRPSPPADKRTRFALTDLGNAERLLAHLDGNVRYSPEVGFFLFDGTVWRQDRFDAVRAACHDVLRTMADEAEGLSAPGCSKELRCKACVGCTLRGWAHRSQSSRAIDSMVRELAAMPSVVVDVEALDAHHHLLACRNGVVDLKTGALLPHDRDLLLSRRLDVDFDPAATAPTWDRFLADVFPGQADLPTYVQRLVGYGISGETSEQCFAVLWGHGSNGKSVFTDTLTHVFRAITVTTPFSTFEERSSGGIPNDLAALKGARLVMASEGERGRRMAEAVIKRVTGRDLISARFMRKEFFEFRPTFLILLGTNHRPSFKGQDEGLWRRVKLLPWSRYFAPAERDHYLGAKLAAEAEGILAWAVRGAVEWYAGGLQDPPVVVESTKGYRETSDALAGFLPGRLVKDRHGDVLGADAYKAYQEWADEEDLPERERWTRRTFYDALEERGIDRMKTRQGQSLIGVRLATKAEREAVDDEPLAPEPEPAAVPEKSRELPAPLADNRSALEDLFEEDGSA